LSKNVKSIDYFGKALCVDKQAITVLSGGYTTA
jgi:hypothetical protein